GAREWWARGSRWRTQDITEADQLAVAVGDLDADRGLAGDRGQDPDIGGGDRVGNVLLWRRDAPHLARGSELHLIAGNRRSPGESGDLVVDLELLEHLGQRVDSRIIGAAPGAVRRAGLEDLGRRQVVGDIT